MNFNEVKSFETILTTTDGNTYSARIENSGKKKLELVITSMPATTEAMKAKAATATKAAKATAATTTETTETQQPANSGWINRLIIGKDTSVSIDKVKNNLLVNLTDELGECTTIEYNKNGKLVKTKSKPDAVKNKNEYRSSDKDIDRILRMF